MMRPLFISFILLLAGCTAPTAQHKTTTTAGDSWIPLPAGTIVVADSMKVSEDQLNNSYFSVQLSVSEGNSDRHKDGFKYDVHATFGSAVADGKIIMPYDGASLKPELRKGEGYSYVMGFVPGAAYNNDTAFHEYYRISGDKNYIRITPLKGFRIEG